MAGGPPLEEEEEEDGPEAIEGIPATGDGTESGGPGSVAVECMGGGDPFTGEAGLRRLAMQRLLRLRSRLRGDNTGVRVCPGLYVGSMAAASNRSPLSLL
jgi:hypothetical protein